MYIHCYSHKDCSKSVLLGYSMKNASCFIHRTSTGCGTTSFLETRYYYIVAVCLISSSATRAGEHASFPLPSLLLLSFCIVGGSNDRHNNWWVSRSVMRIWLLSTEDGLLTWSSYWEVGKPQFEVAGEEVRGIVVVSSLSVKDFAKDAHQVVAKVFTGWRGYNRKNNCAVQKGSWTSAAVWGGSLSLKKLELPCRSAEAASVWGSWISAADPRKPDLRRRSESCGRSAGARHPP